MKKGRSEMQMVLVYVAFRPQDVETRNVARQ